MSEEMELQLRLDSNGRTTTITNNDNITKSNSNNNNTNNNTVTMDYTSKTVSTILTNNTNVKFMDDLYLDCEVADCAILPRTFWVPAKGMKPRCTLEQCALEIFHHHIDKNNMTYDETTSGCEWWVQIRPSPPTGRYSMLVEKKNGNEKNTKKEKETNKHQEEESMGICFHWDKDEDLRLLTDGTMYIHPHLSTVSYFTSFGPPTIVLNYQVHPFTGAHQLPSNTTDAYLSWPKQGKHLSFDGRFLHGAPFDLMEPGSFEQQIATPNNNNNKIQKRRQRRITFLVNIWLNYKPLNVHPFPASMIDKLSSTTENSILFHNDTNTTHTTTAKQSKTKQMSSYYSKEPYTYTTTNNDLIKFQWPLGDIEEKERIEIQLPITKIRNQMQNGGDVSLTYNPDDTDSVLKIPPPIRLVKKEEESIPKKIEQEQQEDKEKTNKRQRVE